MVGNAGQHFGVADVYDDFCIQLACRCAEGATNSVYRLVRDPGVRSVGGRCGFVVSVSAGVHTAHFLPLLHGDACLRDHDRRTVDLAISSSESELVAEPLALAYGCTDSNKRRRRWAIICFEYGHLSDAQFARLNRADRPRVERCSFGETAKLFDEELS